MFEPVSKKIKDEIYLEMNNKFKKLKLQYTIDEDNKNILENFNKVVIFEDNKTLKINSDNDSINPYFLDIY